jgi:uncharacterized phiE125 gp8 family phage protein
MHWLEPEVTVAPTFEPVGLAAAKSAQRIEGAHEDAALEAYLKAARSVVEERTGLKLATQTVRLRAWAFEADSFVLPLAPVQSVTSITYVDNEGATQTLSTDIYTTALFGLTPTIALKYGKTWPAHRCGLGNVVITCVAGYAADAAPEPVKQAIKLLFGDFNAFREQAAPGSVSDVAAVALDSLLINHRRSF